MGSSASPRVGHFDDFLVTCLNSGRRRTKLTLARSLYESEILGVRNCRTWKRSGEIVDDFCSRRGLCLPDFGKPKPSGLARIALCVLILLATIIATGQVVPQIPRDLKLIVFGITTGLSLGWVVLALTTKEARAGRGPGETDRDAGG